MKIFLVRLKISAYLGDKVITKKVAVALIDKAVIARKMNLHII